VTLISHDEVKAARKVHRCDWCENDIAVGESYIRQRIADARDVHTTKMHSECWGAFKRLPRHEQEESYCNTYTRGCTCDKYDAHRCDTPQFHTALAAKEQT
jgi:hypothetical protein